MSSYLTKAPSKLSPAPAPAGRRRAWCGFWTCITAAGVLLGTALSGAQPDSAADNRSRPSGVRSKPSPIPNSASSPRRTASVAEVRNGALAARLARPISMDWDQVSFRSALEDLAAAGRFDLLLDRRVDPDRLFSAKIQNQPLQAGFDQVAGAEQLGVSQLGGLIYVGPSDAAARLRTLAVLRGNELQRLPPDARAPWETMAVWNWPRLSQPRLLLEDLAAEADIELTGLERIPHDLWPAGQLPPLSVADRLTLLANEFDLTYGVSADGRRAELIPVPPKVQLARRYPGGRAAETLAAEWRERSPQATIKLQGEQITVSGLLEDHERLTQPSPAPPGPAATAPVDPSLVRNRLEIKSLPLGGVIEGLAKKLSLEVEMDSPAIERAGISLGQPISIDVKDATTEQLWQAILEPVGLKFTLEKNVLRIAPK